MNDLVGKVMEFEAGEMSANDTVRFFGDLVKTGIVNEFQGSYQRTARDLINAGWIDQRGNVLNLPEDE